MKEVAVIFNDLDKQIHGGSFVRNCSINSLSKHEMRYLQSHPVTGAKGTEKVSHKSFPQSAHSIEGTAATQT